MIMIMMNHSYTLIVVPIIRATSITTNIMYIHPGVVDNSTVTHKLMPMCIRIHISIPLAIPTAMYHLASGHGHDMVRGSAVVDTNTMDTAMDKRAVV